MENPDQYGVDRVVVVVDGVDGGGDAYIDFGTEESVWGGGNEAEGSSERFSGGIPTRITEYVAWKARGTYCENDAFHGRGAASSKCGFNSLRHVPQPLSGVNRERLKI